MHEDPLTLSWSFNITGHDLSIDNFSIVGKEDQIIAMLACNLTYCKTFTLLFTDMLA